MMRLRPSPAVNVIPVLTPSVTHILNVVILPKTEYLFVNALGEVPVTVNAVPLVRVLIPMRSPVTLTTSDQIYLVASNIPPVLSVVQL